jgi:hypothetical protein
VLDYLVEVAVLDLQELEPAANLLNLLLRQFNGSIRPV